MLEIIKNFFSALYKYWMIFAKKFAIIPRTILLTIIYFTVVAITAIVSFIMRKDLLNKRFVDKESFWLDKDHIATDFERCKKQF